MIYIFPGLYWFSSTGCEMGLRGSAIVILQIRNHDLTDKVFRMLFPINNIRLN